MKRGAAASTVISRWCGYSSFACFTYKTFKIKTEMYATDGRQRLDKAGIMEYIKKVVWR